MSAIEKLEQRVSALEAEIARLKIGRQTDRSGHVWLDKVFGSFANDPDYLEAMRLGRQYREEVKPKPKNRKKRKNAHVDS
jgi:hypothetical protein